MKFLSVCSGIEAASVAWPWWDAVGFSEIEKFPSAVLAHHYPGVANFGDMTRYREWEIGAIDLLVGGTPCQSFSVAGLRKGLEDPRGNLMLVYCGILERFRPRWFVWENVPGVLSSNGGRDFGSFLGAVAQLGYGWAYRVLDAQWFGVAQRRRRVFVVGCLGDWASAAQVLFERESLRRDTAPSREAGQTAAPTIAQCSNGGGANGPGRDVDSCESLQVVQPYTVANCLTQRMHKGINSTLDEGQTPVISIHPHCIGRAPEAGPQGKEYLLDGSAYCMDSRGHPQAVVQPIAFTRCDYGNDAVIDGAPTMRCGSNYSAHLAVAFAQNQRDEVRLMDVAGALAADPGMKQQTYLSHAMQVRRLTPVECERLQGFPDGYTNIPWRGKTESPDGPRYKALGNSMAVPVMRWIGNRINMVEGRQNGQ